MRTTGGAATAPHAAAAQSALAILREGGNAVEAMIAAAATIAVVYPHMNSIGGDGFWLIATPGAQPVGIEACGAAAGAATPEAYRAQGLTQIPTRGPWSACTVAGTVSGWARAHEYSRTRLGGRLPLSRLLADAMGYARAGITVSRSQAESVAAKRGELEQQPGFAATFLPDGQQPEAGASFTQPRLAAVFEQLARCGLDDFYRGELARSMATDLQRLGSPVALIDLERHQARYRNPLALSHARGTLYNMPPPSQGLISLLILGMLDRRMHRGMNGLDAPYVHLCVEATKLAFGIRDRHLTDPDYMSVEPSELLNAAALDAMAARINMDAAAPWDAATAAGDTVWLGVIDGRGVGVSFIQSIYHEFGSGIVLTESGITWQNRGCSFALNPLALNPLQPGRRPFHTLNPPLARLANERLLLYGAMGGDGQPQFQSALFSRIAVLGWRVQTALDAPRWLLGRAWGASSDTLKLEQRFPQATCDALQGLGHELELVKPYDELMGHAGAILRHPDGTLEAGSDPRSDGAALGC